jgi:uncharacterized C2H2 Zn-finger protein
MNIAKGPKFKPWAVRVLGDGEILYACPKCSMKFFMLKNEEKYCHNCGFAMDWNVVLCSTDIKTAEDLVALNKAQKPEEFERYYRENGEPRTCCTDCKHYEEGGCSVPPSLKWKEVKVLSLTGGEDSALCDLFQREGEIIKWD